MAATVFPAPGAGSGSIQWNLYSNTTTASSSASTVTITGTTSNSWVGTTPIVNSGTGRFANNTIITSVVNSTSFTVNLTPTVALSSANISIAMGSMQVVTDNSRTAGKLRSAITVKTPSANTNYFNIPKLKSAITVKCIPGSDYKFDVQNLNKRIEVIKNPSPSDGIIYDAFNINKWKMPPNGIQGFFPPSSSNLRKQLEVFKQPGVTYGNYTLSPFANNLWANRLNSNRILVGQQSPKNVFSVSTSLQTVSGANTNITLNSFTPIAPSQNDYVLFTDIITQNQTLALVNSGSSFTPSSSAYAATFTTVGRLVTTTSNSAFSNFGTGDFTIEFWWQLPSLAQASEFFPVTCWDSFAATLSWYITLRTLGGAGTYKWEFAAWLNGTYPSGANNGAVASSIIALSTNTWYHFAVSRSGGILRMFHNGAQVYSNPNTDNIFNVGAVTFNGINGGSPAPVNALMSNVRIVNGKGVYTGPFTVPLPFLSKIQSGSTNITSLAGTETTLLALQNATFIDNSNTNASFTNIGSVTSALSTTLSNPVSQISFSVPTNSLSNLNINNPWTVQGWDPEVFQQSNVVTNTGPATARERLYYSTLAPGRYGNYIPYKTAPAATSTANYFNTGKLRSAIVIKNPSPRDDVYYDAFNLSKRIEVIKNPTPRDNIAYRSNNINRWKVPYSTAQIFFSPTSSSLQKRIEVTRSPTQVPSSYALSNFAAPYTYFNNTNRIAVGANNSKIPVNSNVNPSVSGANVNITISSLSAINNGDYLLLTDNTTGNQALAQVITSPSSIPNSGQQLYTSTGSNGSLGFTSAPAISNNQFAYSFIAPTGVTSVSVVAIGGGGSSGAINSYMSGGGGGGLGWKNNISVTPGQSYTVVVGSGGIASGAANGSTSYFISAPTVSGVGGTTGTSNNTAANITGAAGGGYVGDGGGAGGASGSWLSSNAGYASGGGGAGGYTGSGGNGGTNGNSSSGTAGEGGGGGGGGGSSPGQGQGGAGGGVGTLGSGTSGTAGVATSTGGGGSGGDNGFGISGGAYGGGGGAQGGGSGGAGAGSSGAVRIIWGAGRSFPNTATNNNPITITVAASSVSNLNTANTWNVQSWELDLFRQTNVATTTAPTNARERLYYANLVQGKYGQTFPYKQQTTALANNLLTTNINKAKYNYPTTPEARTYRLGKATALTKIANPTPRDDLVYDVNNLRKPIEVIKNPAPSDAVIYDANNINRLKLPQVVTPTNRINAERLSNIDANYWKYFNNSNAVAVGTVNPRNTATVTSLNPQSTSGSNTLISFLKGSTLQPFVGDYVLLTDQVTGYQALAVIITASATSSGVIAVPLGQALFTTPGTTTWTAPAGVFNVSAVAIGAGGSGGTSLGAYAGGGGGGLAWVNNIPVVPGQTYNVQVGSNGTTGPSGDSYFINTSTASGGVGGTSGASSGSAGGTFTVTNLYGTSGGGVGGTGGSSTGTPYTSGGGGGAGGYSGKGGNGGTGGLAFTAVSGGAGTDGGGGGGGSYNNSVGGYFQVPAGGGGGTTPFGAGVAGTGGAGGSAGDGSGTSGTASGTNITPTNTRYTVTIAYSGSTVTTGNGPYNITGTFPIDMATGTWFMLGGGGGVTRSVLGVFTYLSPTTGTYYNLYNNGVNNNAGASQLFGCISPSNYGAGGGGTGAQGGSNYLGSSGAVRIIYPSVKNSDGTTVRAFASTAAATVAVTDQTGTISDTYGNNAYAITVPTASVSNLNPANPWTIQFWDPELFAQTNVRTNTSTGVARENLYYARLAPGKYGAFFPSKPTSAGLANNITLSNLQKRLEIFKNPTPNDATIFDAFNVTKLKWLNLSNPTPSDGVVYDVNILRRMEVLKNPTPRDAVLYTTPNVKVKFPYYTTQVLYAPTSSNILKRIFTVKNPTPRDDLAYDVNNVNKFKVPSLSSSVFYSPASNKLEIIDSAYWRSKSFSNAIVIGQQSPKTTATITSTSTGTSGSNTLINYLNTSNIAPTVGDYLLITDTSTNTQTLAPIVSSSTTYTLTAGQALFTNGTVTGTGGAFVSTTANQSVYNWTAPAGIYSVSVVAVGAGGSGGNAPPAGGGGALAWANNIAVTPGTTYTVRSGLSGVNSTSGTASTFTAGSVTITAGGGTGGDAGTSGPGGPGGTWSVTGLTAGLYGGGNGGKGGDGAGYNYVGGGGGGAGGYGGNGGAGAKPFPGFISPTAAATGSGGGGGGGANVSNADGDSGGGGGGVGLLGTDGGQGAAAFIGAGGYGGGSGGGGGGSGGAGGSGEGGATYSGPGGSYGGGGAGDNLGDGGASGGVGAIRIIWPAVKRADNITIRSFGATVATTLLATDQSTTFLESVIAVPTASVANLDPTKTWSVKFWDPEVIPQTSVVTNTSTGIARENLFYASLAPSKYGLLFPGKNVYNDPSNIISLGNFPSYSRFKSNQTQLFDAPLIYKVDNTILQSTISTNIAPTNPRENLYYARLVPGIYGTFFPSKNSYNDPSNVISLSKIDNSIAQSTVTTTVSPVNPRERLFYSQLVPGKYGNYIPFVPTPGALPANVNAERLSNIDSNYWLKPDNQNVVAVGQASAKNINVLSLNALVTASTSGNNTVLTYTPTYYATFSGSNSVYSIIYSFSTGISIIDFTIECWAYATTTTNAADFLFTTQGTFGLNIFHVGTTWTAIVGDQSNVYVTLSGTASLNAWHHFAVTRSGNIYTFWIDGIAVMTATSSQPNIPYLGDFYIGSSSSGTNFGTFTGYISNLRFVKTAIYTGTFAPIGPLNTIQNARPNVKELTGNETILLTLQNSALVDNSNYLGPIPYMSSTTYAAIGFSSTLTFPTFSPLPQGPSSPFTIEYWVMPKYSISAPLAYNTNGTEIPYSTGLIDNSGNFNLNSWGTYPYFASRSVTGWSSIIGPTPLATYVWSHIAVSFDGSVVRLFVNGNNVASSNTLRLSTTATNAGFIIRPNPQPGSMSNFRFVQGRALYTNNFTPSGPLTAVPGTVLLTLQDAVPVDNSINSYPVIANNIVTSSAPGQAIVNAVPAIPLTPIASPTPAVNDYLLVTDTNNNQALAQITATTATTITVSTSSLANLNTSSNLIYQLWDPEVFAQTNVRTTTSTGVARENLYYATLAKGRYGRTFPSAPPACIPGSDYKFDVNTFRQLVVIKNPTPNDAVTYDPYTLSNFDSKYWTYPGNANKVAVGTANPKLINYSKASSQVISGSNAILTFNSPSSDINYITSGSTYYGTFNGSTQYLLMAQSAGLITTGPFTIEAWVYPTSFLGTPTVVEDNYWNIGNNGGWYFLINTNGTLILQYGIVTVSALGSISSNGTISTNTWSHIAVVRDNNNFINFYINGQLANTPTILAQSLNLTTGGSQVNWNTRIGMHIADAGISNAFSGFISNVRIVNNKAVYTGNFTPLGPLSTVQPARPNVVALGGTETSLLALQSVAVTTDNSVNNFTITNPTPLVIMTLSQALGTVPVINDYALITDTVTNNQALAQINGTANSGGGGTTTVVTGTYSAQFNGTSQYLSTDTGQSPLTQDFTIEGWFYKNSTWSTTTCGLIEMIDTGSISYYLSSNGTIRSGPQNQSSYSLGATTGLATNTWYHIAFVRKSNSARVYVNGTPLQAAVSDTNNYGGGTWTIGGNPGDSYFNGYISNVRIVYGSAVYDPASATITVPTSPLTNIAGTLLLTCQNATIIDNSTNNFTLTNNGTVTTSSSNVPNLTTSTVISLGATSYVLSLPTSSLSNLNISNPWAYQLWEADLMPQSNIVPNSITTPRDRLYTSIATPGRYGQYFPSRAISSITNNVNANTLSNFDSSLWVNPLTNGVAVGQANPKYGIATSTINGIIRSGSNITLQFVKPTSLVNLGMELSTSDYLLLTDITGNQAVVDTTNFSSVGFGAGSTITVPLGQALYDSTTVDSTLVISSATNQRLYTWTCPTNVYSVSVVAVGGGGGGGFGSGSDGNFPGGAGGGGGGLGWANNISVIPGTAYTVVVGSSGIGSTDYINSQNGTAGGDSYFISATIVKGGGGVGGTRANGGGGGTFAGTGGGSGGSGGSTAGSFSPGGGGGAGGYGDNGGAGGTDAATATASTGGGGAGGQTYASWDGSGGGGVGIAPTSITNGAVVGATGSGATTGGGGGGSGGTAGGAGQRSFPSQPGTYPAGGGGLYGGGGGGATVEYGSERGGNGGTGAVRIIWPGNKLLDGATVRSFGATTGTTILASDQTGTITDTFSLPLYNVTVPTASVAKLNLNNTVTVQLWEADLYKQTNVRTTTSPTKPRENLYYAQLVKGNKNAVYFPSKDSYNTVTTSIAAGNVNKFKQPATKNSVFYSPVSNKLEIIDAAYWTDKTNSNIVVTGQASSKTPISYPEPITKTINGDNTLLTFNNAVSNVNYMSRGSTYYGVFNGTTQYLTVGTTSSFNFLHNGTSDWTIESWVYFNSLPASNNYTLMSTGAWAATDPGITIYFGSPTGSNNFALRISGNNSPSIVYLSAANTISSINTWYHVAWTFTALTKEINLYVNGVSTPISVPTGALNASSLGFAYSSSNAAFPLAIGKYQYSFDGGYLNGYVSNLRIVTKVVYTGIFTPQGPLNIIQSGLNSIAALSGNETKLLTLQDATIIDNSVGIATPIPGAGTNATFTIGAVGDPSVGPANGGFGGTTTFTFSGTTISAAGGAGGQYNSGSSAQGGAASGSGVDAGITGGAGAGTSGDRGGGAGGAIGGVNAPAAQISGTTGASAADFNGLAAAVTALGYTYGSGGGGFVTNNFANNNISNGLPATGFGAGGGSAGNWGGDGGAGYFGGGGGGGAGLNLVHTGGTGGSGCIVIQKIVNGVTSYDLLQSGSSYAVPSNTVYMKVWVIGGGGGGAGAPAIDTTSGGGGGAGGIAVKTFATTLTNFGSVTTIASTSVAGSTPATNNYLLLTDNSTSNQAIAPISSTTSTSNTFILSIPTSNVSNLNINNSWTAQIWDPEVITQAKIKTKLPPVNPRENLYYAQLLKGKYGTQDFISGQLENNTSLFLTDTGLLTKYRTGAFGKGVADPSATPKAPVQFWN